MQTLPGFKTVYESSVVITSTLLAQQSKVKMGIVTQKYSRSRFHTDHRYDRKKVRFLLFKVHVMCA